ncbi:hypothetical protein [Pandoraea soli]
MERELFHRFSNDLVRLGADGIAAPQFSLGISGVYELRYTPFEYVNRRAKLVIVGITPGNTQLELSYGKAQELLRKGHPVDLILHEIKKVGAFGGPSMRPNLLKMLRHFQFEQLLGIEDVESLWGSDADLLQSTSVVPHAAFKAGDMFNGSFDEAMASPLLRECFLDCFVPSVEEMDSGALFVGLGRCPEAALEWCLQRGVLQRKQVLGAFCHPSSNGGSATRYYLREVAKAELSAQNPVRHRTDWLDQAYEQMQTSTSALRGNTAPTSKSASRRPDTPSKTRSEHDASGTNTAMPTTSASVPEELATILAAMVKARYTPTQEKVNVKVAEFQAPNGRVVYVIKTSSRLNSVKLAVHPGLSHAALNALPGVRSISDRHWFNSNMRRFPKRINRGERPTAYGWKISIDTLDDLTRFLSAFGGASL